MVKPTLSLLLLALAPLRSIAQSSRPLPVIEQKMIERGLLDVQKLDPDILVELKYSTTDNFIGRDVYGELRHAYLQPEMAKRLTKANALLKKEKSGYKLLIYDAARPNSAQYDLWNALDHLNIPARSKTQYVADPKIGSNHNFGCAIDLTIADDKGNPLDMGTKFDYFGPLAYPRSEQEMLKKGKLTVKQIENRQLLRKVMTKVGFKVNTTEWWHFDGMSKAQARAKYGMIP
ncbi:M15 family metallopeptidase [Dyadobacter sp. CY261]|uniref:M15 family metallopeptidase n=1 Tax=Dyadobacter sp. CY261 TaxID=2907203 RepID=UPI0038D50E58